MVFGPKTDPAAKELISFELNTPNLLQEWLFGSKEQALADRQECEALVEALNQALVEDGLLTPKEPA